LAPRPDPPPRAAPEAGVPSVLRLIDALCDAGATTITHPACPRCRRVSHLHRRIDGQWSCRNCVAKSRAVASGAACRTPLGSRLRRAVELLGGAAGVFLSTPVPTVWEAATPDALVRRGDEFSPRAAACDSSRAPAGLLGVRELPPTLGCAGGPLGGVSGGRGDLGRGRVTPTPLPPPVPAGTGVAAPGSGRSVETLPGPVVHGSRVAALGQRVRPW
jgi:ribosomal protein L37AE/L43A